MMMDENRWNIVREQIKCSFPYITDWAMNLFDKPLSEIKKQVKISLESKVTDQSYIDFLKEQIELNARGQEWTALLTRRLKALEPLVGKEIMFLSVEDNNRFIWIKIDPNNNRVILVETDD